MSQKLRLERELSMVHYDIKEAYNNNRSQKEDAAVRQMKSNPKSFYSFAKRHSNMRGDLVMLRDSNGQVSRDPKAMSNTLQDQFSSVYSNPCSEDKELPNFPQLETQMLPDAINFTENDFVDASKNLKMNSAPGPDGIPSCLIKPCAAALSVPLAMMWNESFELGIVPSYYKISYVCPIYKKGDRTCPANYRPISLTSHIEKVAERVIRKIMVEYLEKNSIISEVQHGFCSGRSTLTQLLCYFDKVFAGLLRGNETDAIYLDYAKAFDKVDHQLLIEKVKRYGFPSILVSWITSFLSVRHQVVVVKGVHSREAPVISGVPQGTVLGPILFLIYINDLENKVLNSNIFFFADDTRLSSEIITLEGKSLLEMDLAHVLDWSKSNNMELNAGKFEMISFQGRPKTLLYELPFHSELYSYNVLEDITLYPKEAIKDLGVTVTADLSWSCHIATIVGRARGVAAWVLSVFKSREHEVMLNLYKSMVRGHLEYCCPLWHPTNIHDTQLLEGVQREFTRKIQGFKTLNYWQRLKALNLFSLQRRRERYILICMWRILHKLMPNPNIKFRPESRLGIQAIVPSLGTLRGCATQSKYDASFAVIGPKLWNALPRELTLVSSDKAFKSQLTSLLRKLEDIPPTPGYVSTHDNSLPEVLRRANGWWSLL